MGRLLGEGHGRGVKVRGPYRPFRFSRLRNAVSHGRRLPLARMRWYAALASTAERHWCCTSWLTTQMVPITHAFSLGDRTQALISGQEWTALLLLTPVTWAIRPAAY